MKRSFLAFLFAASILSAEEKPCEISYWDLHPLHIGGNALCIGSADVTDTPLGGTLVFDKYNAYIDLLIPITKKSFFFPRVGWTAFTLDWDKNPKFNETFFTYTQFALTFYSIELPTWRWIMRAEYNLDNKHFDNPGQYGLFSGLIWGANELFEKWHYHVGALGYAGMEGAQFYPLIGVDFAPDKHWTFSAIFPIEYFVQYSFNPSWQLAIKVRPLKERFRAGEDQPQPKSVFSYSSTSAELNLHFEVARRLEIEAYGGWNFGGGFYIKNQTGHSPLYTDIGGAPYGGASLNFGF